MGERDQTISITKRGSSYQATVTHKGERYRRQFATEAEATMWIAEARVSLLRGVRPERRFSQISRPSQFDAAR